MGGTALMAMRLDAAQAYTVYAALDDMLAARRSNTGTKHSYSLSEEEHLALQGRYLRAWCTLERIEKKETTND